MSVPNLGTDSPELTEDTASTAFEALLSDEEDQQEAPKPPVQETPEPEPDDAEVEPSSEQGQAEEGESDPDDTTEATDKEQPAETLYPLVVNGVTEMVTLQEALKGYSRQKDYTQKSQALAEQRKQLEAELPAVRGERVKLAEYLTQLESALKEATPEEPDWARLQQEAPDDFPKVWAQWQAHEKRMNTVREEKQAAQAAVQNDRAQQHQAYLTEQRSKLTEVIPEWKDAAVAKAEKPKMVEYAKALGYEDKDLAEVTDHRMMVLLRDAMRYRELKKKTPAITERIDKVRTATPGSAGSVRPPTTAESKARARLAKSGRQEDAAAALEAMLD